MNHLKPECYCSCLYGKRGFVNGVADFNHNLYNVPVGSEVRGMSMAAGIPRIGFLRIGNDNKALLVADRTRAQRELEAQLRPRFDGQCACQWGHSASHVH